MSRLRRLLPTPLRRAASKRTGGQARAAFWGLAQSMTPYVAVEYRDDVFVLPTAIDGKLFVNAGRRSDLVVLERVCAILRDAGRLAEKETIVDVGAHIGTTTIPALTHHGLVRAVAIEPDPAHLPLLRVECRAQRARGESDGDCGRCFGHAPGAATVRPGQPEGGGLSLDEGTAGRGAVTGRGLGRDRRARRPERCSRR